MTGYVQPMPQRRVLLLEDNWMTAESIMRGLEIRGIEGVRAATVAEALEAYDVDRFDVIVCDYDLPDGTGLDFLARVRGCDKAVTVLSSGLDRSKQVEQAGLHVDFLLDKGKVGELWDVITGRVS